MGERRVNWSAPGTSSDSASAYLENVTGLAAIEAYKRRSHRLLAPEQGDRLLDVGCGTGEDVVMLADEVGTTGAVIGIDRSPALIADARDRAADVPVAVFQVGDAHALGIQTGVVDGSRADRVLQHLPDPGVALQELCRVTASGGIVAVSEPDWRTLELVVPPAEDAVTGSVIDPDWANVRHPAMGATLYGRCQEAGLSDVVIDPVTVVVTDATTATEVFGLEGRLAAMRAADAISSEQARAWQTAVRRADAAGTFFGSMTGFTVAGTVQSQE